MRPSFFCSPISVILFQPLPSLLGMAKTYLTSAGCRFSAFPTIAALLLTRNSPLSNCMILSAVLLPQQSFLERFTISVSEIPPVNHRLTASLL